MPLNKLQIVAPSCGALHRNIISMLHQYMAHKEVGRYNVVVLSPITHSFLLFIVATIVYQNCESRLVDSPQVGSLTNLRSGRQQFSDSRRFSWNYTFRCWLRIPRKKMEMKTSVTRFKTKKKFRMQW